MSDTIKLAKNEYKLVPAGNEVALTITRAEAKPTANPSVIEIIFSHGESILKNKYDLNIRGGEIAFAILARCILGADADELSISKDLPLFVGKTVTGEVVHTEYEGKTYANLKKVLRLIESYDEL